MELRKLIVMAVAVSMMSIGLGTLVSDNVSAVFIEPLSGNGLSVGFRDYDVAWNDAGTMAVVVGHGASGSPHAYAYFPGNDTYYPLPNPNYNPSQYLFGVDYSREKVIPMPKVLLVDADYNEDGVINAYTSALSVCNANVTLWDVWDAPSVDQGKPDSTVMADYDVVIWVPSRDMNGLGGMGDAFNIADENNVATYLDNGGNFFLSNIFYTDYTGGGSFMYASGDFAYDYLGIEQITDGFSSYDDYVNETAGDAVYDGVGQCWLDWSQYNWVNSPDSNDEIYPAGAEICFWGTDTGMGTYMPMGARYDNGTFKSVFLGFPFEVIDSNSQKDAVMKKTLEWFVPGSQSNARQSRALVVDADYYNDGLMYAYYWPLVNNSWDVTVWDVYGNSKSAQGKPTTDDMVGYDLVIWVPTRDMYGPGGSGDAFNPGDENQVESYLGAGGDFFLSNIYWSDYTSGAGNYFNGDFAYDVFSISSMTNMYSDKEDSVEGGVGSVFEGFYPNPLNWSQYGWTGQPWNSDEINPQSSIPCMDIIQDSPYSTATGGVYYDDGTFKSMFMGFPVETLTYPDTDDFWNRALEWFVPGSTSYDEENFTYQDVWWLCGDNAGAGINSVYRVVPSEGLEMQSVGVTGSFQDVAVDHLGNPLFVGTARPDMQYYDYLGDQWYAVTSALDMGNYDFYGIDFNENDRRFYIAGYGPSGMMSVWYSDAAPLDTGSAKAYEFSGLPPVGNTLYDIEWNQFYDYGLAVGDNMVYEIEPYGHFGNGSLAYTTVNTSFGIANAVSWDTDGWNEAAIVGQNGLGHGYYWRYYHSNPKLIDGYDSGNTTQYYSCAMKPPSSPKWLLIPAPSGSIRVNIEEKDQSGEVTLNVNYPHIFGMDMWKQADALRSSMLDVQVDADSVYTIFVEANYTVDGVERWTDAVLEITAWYDDGSTGTWSVPGDPSWSMETYRTSQFNITYDVSNQSASVVYPAPIGSAYEFYVDSVWEDPTAYTAQMRHRVYINISFGKQTAAADGGSFTSGGAVGGNIWDENSSFNDANSWDMRVSVHDNIQYNVRNDTYGEFGIRKYASISVFGNPGGSAPPGATNYALSTPSQIHYASNTAYYVNVSIQNLYKNGVPGPDYIPAGYVAVQNTHSHATGTSSDIATAVNFPGPDSDMCVWGISGTPLSPVANGTESAGPGYSDYTAESHSQVFEVTEVYWWVTVPAGLPEGTYRSTITFTVWN